MSGDSSMQRLDGWLTVPTEPQPSYIAMGMTEEDFKLLEDSISLWKSRLIKPPPEAKPPIGGDQPFSPARKE